MNRVETIGFVQALLKLCEKKQYETVEEILREMYEESKDKKNCDERR